MKVFLALTLGITVLLTGCGNNLQENESVPAEKSSKSDLGGNQIKITNIVRVFFHELPNHFSVMSKGKDGRLITHDISFATVYADVSTNDTAWAIKDSSSHGEIHIHDPADINGAGWSQVRDKTTYRGTTVSVQ